MPTVLVTLGTDHHPFQRLVDWVDQLATDHPELDVVVQHGRTAAPRVAQAVEQVTQAELRARMRAADVVVAQGGPGGIVDARESGRRPVVVPRRPELGEIVDGHQITFARHLHQQGLVQLAETAQELEAAVLGALRDPETWVVPPTTSPTPATARAVAEAVDQLLHRPRRRLPERLLGRRRLSRR
ncbi:hypothetical protein GCM10027446_13850 [Angustibacter peucedani]